VWRVKSSVEPSNLTCGRRDSFRILWQDPSIVFHYLILADVKHLMSAPPKAYDSIHFPYRRDV